MTSNQAVFQPIRKDHKLKILSSSNQKHISFPHSTKVSDFTATLTTAPSLTSTTRVTFLLGIQADPPPFAITLRLPIHGS